jgi:hypothetical protein
LDTATKNLAPRAAAKVCEDITAHFESSVEHHQLEGMGLEEARVLAVRELGDAASSAKGFERVYLTRNELAAARLSKMRAKKFSGTTLIYTIAILSYFVFPPENLKEIELTTGQNSNSAAPHVI